MYIYAYHGVNVIVSKLSSGPFHMINSGSCESNGMQVILSDTKCYTAAAALGLSYTSVNVLTDPWEPQGCIYSAKHNWLALNGDSPSGTEILCGVPKSKCICIRPGKI